MIDFFQMHYSTPSRNEHWRVELWRYRHTDPGEWEERLPLGFAAVEVDAETNRARLNLLHILDGYRGRGFGTLFIAACMNRWKPLEHALGPVGDRMVVRGSG